MASVSIQVAVRCRPFVCDDELGVSMFQNSEVEGEINLLRSKYSTKRFAFSWAWWSARMDTRITANPKSLKMMPIA